MQEILLFTVIVPPLILLSAYVYAKFGIKGFLAIFFAELLLTIFFVVVFPSVFFANMEVRIRNDFWNALALATVVYGALGSFFNTIGLALVVLFRVWRSKSDNSDSHVTTKD